MRPCDVYIYVLTSTREKPKQGLEGRGKSVCSSRITHKGSQLHVLGSSEVLSAVKTKIRLKLHFFFFFFLVAKLLTKDSA